MSERRPASASSKAYAAWQRWEMDTFDQPRQAPEPERPAKPEPVRLPTAEQVMAQIRQVENLARTQAHEEGHAAGHAKGFQEGKQAGLAQGLQEGREKGHAAGYQEGQALARQEAQRIDAMAGACADAIEHLQQDIGQALVSLATSIAEQVLRTTLDAHPEKILDLVREVVSLHGDNDAMLVLRVHPDDYDLVRRHLDADTALKRWRLQHDEDIARGGCMAETALGAIDATLQTRWRRVLGTLGRTGLPAKPETP